MAQRCLDRHIQREIDKKGNDNGKAKKNGHAMQAGARVYPEPPLPGQHLEKPGEEAELDLKPMYDAPHYKGSEKLKDKVALVVSAGRLLFSSRERVPTSR